MAGIKYDAPPTVAAFMVDDSFGRLIAGPIGSGKTTGCIIELFRRAAAQSPAPDGFRYSRFAICRQTLRQLEDTVLKDITSWFAGAGDSVKYKVSSRTVWIELGDIRSEWPLIPLEDQEDRRRLLSLQLTGAWLSECIEMDVNLVADIGGRCGRYPSGPTGVATWKGMIADTNFPVIGSDWYKFMENPPPKWKIWKQPSGLSDKAENLDWLWQTEASLKLPVGHPDRLAQGRGYYENAATNTNNNWVKRYVHAEYGPDPSGEGVYVSSFDRDVHVVEDIEPQRGLPIIVGQDFGRNPWSIISQLTHDNVLNIIEEVPAENVGLDYHLRNNLIPTLRKEKYQSCPVIIIGDPAGRARSSLFEINEYELLKRMGFTAFPAITNDPEVRILAVESFLLNTRNGNPKFQISASGAPTMLRGFEGLYRYAKMKTGQLKVTPDKNEYSHGHDCIQYICLCCNGDQYKDVVWRALRPTKKVSTGPKMSSAAWT